MMLREDEAEAEIGAERRHNQGTTLRLRESKEMKLIPDWDWER